MPCRLAVLFTALGLLAMPMACSQPEGGARVAAEPAAPTPLDVDGPRTVETIAARSVHAVGGRAALDGLQTLELRYEARGEGAGTPDQVVHLRWARGGAFRSVYEGGFATIAGGDGRLRWTTREASIGGLRFTSQGEGVVSDGWLVTDANAGNEERREVQWLLAMIEPTRLMDDAQRVPTFAGPRWFADQWCDAITLEPREKDQVPSVKATETYYYDPDSGRLLGASLGQLAVHPDIIVFTSWRHADGLWLPDAFDFRLGVFSADFTSFAATTIRVNELDGSLLSAPPVVARVAASAR